MMYIIFQSQCNVEELMKPQVIKDDLFNIGSFKPLLKTHPSRKKVFVCLTCHLHTDIIIKI